MDAVNSNDSQGLAWGSPFGVAVGFRLADEI